MARLTIARKLAVEALAIWKSGEAYDETKLSKVAAYGQGASKEG